MDLFQLPFVRRCSLKWWPHRFSSITKCNTNSIQITKTLKGEDFEICTTSSCDWMEFSCKCWISRPRDWRVIGVPTRASWLVAALEELYERGTPVRRTPSWWILLWFQIAEGYALPDWASEVYPSPMQNLTGQYYKEYYAGSDEAVRLLVGKLTYCLIQNQIIKNQTGTVKNREIFKIWEVWGSEILSLYTRCG